jgi:hypothetical protein
MKYTPTIGRCNSLRSITREGASERANRFSKTAMSSSGEGDELDLNPVLLDSLGKGCVVVDAVVFQG